ncbi:Leukocyte-endothelial cell adhesion molecule 3 [Entamoeba marina]
MFNWFYRQSSAVELHTTFIDDKTWVAELNSTEQTDAVKEIFAETFDADNFVIINEGKSVSALLVGDEKYQCTLTFGYNGDNVRLAVISYLDDEDQTIVKPIINAFSTELESASLLYEQKVKEQKKRNVNMVSMKELVYDRDVILNEEEFTLSVILRENVDVKKLLGKIAKVLKDKYLLNAKTENGKLCFAEAGNAIFRIVLQVGRNSDKQRVLALSASEGRVYWKELVEKVIETMMDGKCLNSYSLTASLRKNLQKTIKGNTSLPNAEIVDTTHTEVEIPATKETTSDKQNEEKDEKKS